MWPCHCYSMQRNRMPLVADPHSPRALPPWRYGNGIAWPKVNALSTVRRKIHEPPVESSWDVKPTVKLVRPTKEARKCTDYLSLESCFIMHSSSWQWWVHWAGIMTFGSCDNGFVGPCANGNIMTAVGSTENLLHKLPLILIYLT